jgi:hypothetical protein
VEGIHFVVNEKGRRSPYRSQIDLKLAARRFPYGGVRLFVAETLLDQKLIEEFGRPPALDGSETSLGLSR